MGRATDSYKRENGETVYLFDIEDEIIKEETVNQRIKGKAKWRITNRHTKYSCHIAGKVV